MATTFIYGLSSESGMIRYIGKSNNPNKRLYVHKCMSARKNPHLYRWIKNSKNIDVVILDEVDVSEWQFWERWYIELFKSWCIDLVNITKGGDGCDGYKHTDEAKALMRAKSRDISGSKNPMYGKYGPNNPNTGRVNSEESIRKMSIAQSGKNNPMYGKEVSMETRNKLRKSKGFKIKINGIEYDSVRSACNTEGIDRGTFRYRTKKGYIYEDGAWVKL